MSVNNGTLAHEVDGNVEYIHPKTTAELVEYDTDQSIKDKIKTIDANINSINNRITTITEFLDGYESSDPDDSQTAPWDLTIDSTLTETSENPVQNKVIIEELNKKASTEYVDNAISKLNVGGDDDTNTNNPALKFTSINGDAFSDFKNATNDGISSDNYVSVFRSDPIYAQINSNQEAITLTVGVNIHEKDIIKYEVVSDSGVTITSTGENGGITTTVSKTTNNTHYKTVDGLYTSYSFGPGANVYIKHAILGNTSKSGIAFTNNSVNGYISIDSTTPEVYVGGGSGENLAWVKKLAFIDDVTSNVLEAIYPIGSIYMNANNINPGSLLGGVWEPWGSGRVPVGVDVNDERFKESEMTGGETTHVLTKDELPEHNHTIPAHSHGLGNHTHTIPTHSHGLGNHTHKIESHSHELESHSHTIPAHSHGLGNHTHSIPAHSHGLGNHTHEIGSHTHEIQDHKHGIPILSGTTNNTGEHAHSISSTNTENYTTESGTLPIKEVDLEYNNQSETIQNVSVGGIHNHTVTIDASETNSATLNIELSDAYTSGEAEGNTDNSEILNSGFANGNTGDSNELTSGESTGTTKGSGELISGESIGNTNDSEVLTSGESMGNTNDSEVLTSETIGSNNAHNNLQPYITCYMWKRIA